MTERAPAPARSPPPRHPAPAGGRATDAEIRDVVGRAARVPDGLALLEGAPLECAAVLLGVAPPAIERVRTALEDALARDAARALFARAFSRLPAPAGVEEARPAAPRDAGELLAAATRRPGGLGLLLAAAPECAAVVFGVHPDLVHAAREAARRRGLSQDLPPDA